MSVESLNRMYGVNTKPGGGGNFAGKKSETPTRFPKVGAVQ